MKKTIIFIFSALISLTGFSQANIAAARAMGVGSTVTITGVVTNGDELGPIRYIEDATAGIALYDPIVLAGIVRGVEVTVTGVLVDYNGLMEMQPVNSITVNSAGNFVAPQLITPLQVGESTEGELIQIDNVIFNNGGSFFTAGIHLFDANGETGNIYIKTGSPLENSMIPIGLVTLIGISSQYTFSLHAYDGYQILPRNSADIIQTVALSTPIWYDDFSNPSTWVIDHDPLACSLDWQIGYNSCQGSYAIADIISTTAANGWAMIDSDFYGGLTGGNEMEDSWLTTANP